MMPSECVLHGSLSNPMRVMMEWSALTDCCLESRGPSWNNSETAPPPIPSSPQNSQTAYQCRLLSSVLPRTLRHRAKQCRLLSPALPRILGQAAKPRRLLSPVLSRILRQAAKQHRFLSPVLPRTLRQTAKQRRLLSPVLS